MAQGAQRAGNDPIPGFHMTEGEALDMARRGIEPPGASTLIRRAKPADVVLELSEADLADTVTIVCFVDTKPWTHERPLDQGEKAVVPRRVAKLMHESHQVTIIE